MSDHETTLRGMARFHHDESAERAACLAGAEALRLVREYREAHAAYNEARRGNSPSVEMVRQQARNAAQRALLTENPR